jgi:heptosyltransferase II
MATGSEKGRPWTQGVKPKRILAMRFQAMGDMVITLPYLQSLKSQLPDSELHFLTRKEVSDIPLSLEMFHRVLVIGGGRNAKIQFIICLALLPFLWFQRYDVVMDLQNHRISRIICKLLFPKAWSEFDRVSPILAGERTRLAINSIGITSVKLGQPFRFKFTISVEGKMKQSGWDGNSAIIVLNPAGAFETRNWPLDSYLAFAELWLAEDYSTQFMLLGLPKISGKAAYLKSKLMDKLIDMTYNTNPLEAFLIIKKTMLVISEDSGLLHMAWVQDVPTIGIYGSSNSLWSSPTGIYSYCFNSSDLPCGNCLLETCKFNDNHCLTRITPQAVLVKAQELLRSVS